jgi:uncharacterized protein YybS (DUF2232 family)
MNIKFILTQFVEMTIKTFIIFCFSLSVFIWIVSFAFYALHDFNIDFMAIDSCYDSGRWWNDDERTCMWVNEEKQ